MRRALIHPLRSALAISAAFAFGGRSNPAQAGAWTEPAGEGRAILTLRGATAGDYFDAGGDTNSGPTFRKDNVEAYVTYGITDAATLVLQTAFVHLHPDSSAASVTGWDETLIGVQQRLWENENQIVSAQISALAPGDSDLTSGGVDWEGRGLYGRNFELFGHAAYIDIELAYRWRANGFADQLRPELTLGVWLQDNLMVMAQSFNTFTTTSGEDQYFEGEQQKAQLSAIYRLNDDVALQLGGFATLGGRNTPAERGALASLWFDF